MTFDHHDRENRFVGLLVGGAVGDALGLPAEGLPPGRLRKRWQGPVRHRLLFGRGMLSDDTEHAMMTARALLESGEDSQRFARSLAAKLRWWIIALPAGTGLATARACFRLWLGVPPGRSGVRSAGNGPSMRSAIIGARFAEQPELRRAFVTASSRVTHTDPRAITAALAVAEAASWIVRGKNRGAFPDELRRLSDEPDWITLCERLSKALVEAESVEAFARELCGEGGVSGFAYHSVPVAIFAWLKNEGDYESTVSSAIRCGGDTDSVAAIAGALADCETGKEGIPAEWRERLVDWPLTWKVVAATARNLALGEGRAPAWFWPGVLPRNAFFLLVVLVHGFRRLLPPY